MLYNSAGYKYGGQIFDALFANANIKDILYSGWPIFEQLSYMREQIFPIPENGIMYRPDTMDHRDPEFLNNGAPIPRKHVQEVKDRVWYDEVEEKITKKMVKFIPKSCFFVKISFKTQLFFYKSKISF